MHVTEQMQTCCVIECAAAMSTGCCWTGGIAASHWSASVAQYWAASHTVCLVHRWVSMFAWHWQHFLKHACMTRCV